jgi:chromosome segregation ATPase
MLLLLPNGHFPSHLRPFISHQMSDVRPPTYEELKDRYLKQTRKLQHQQQELEKVFRNQKALESALSDRDRTIDSLLKLKEELTAELELLRAVPPSADSSAEVLGELASAFNSEHRDLLSQIEALKELNANQTSEIESLRSEIAGVREQSGIDPEDARARLSNAISQVEALRSQAMALERERDEAVGRIADFEVLERRVGVIEAEKQELKSEVAILRSECAAVQAKLRESWEMARQSGMKNERLTAELDSMTRAEAGRLREMDALRSQIEKLEAARREQDMEIARLTFANREKERVKEEAEMLKKRVDELRGELKKQGKVSEQIEAGQKREAQLKALVAALEANKVSLEQQLRAAQTQVENTRTQLHQSESKRRELEEAAKSIDLEKAQIRTEMSNLRETVAALEATHSEDQAHITKLARDRKKLELAKHQADQKWQSAEAEKQQLMERVATMEKSRAPTVGPAPVSAVFPDYIRKLLLQFFIQDGSTREALIPVILAIVQCDRQQITQATRAWVNSNQIISHAFSFFGKS